MKMMKLKTEIHPMFPSILSKEQIPGADDEQDLKANFIRRRKLCLVLNLDYTLLHAEKCDNLTATDKKYISFVERQICVLPHLGFTIKLRPYIKTFISEVTLMYDLVIFSKGSSELLSAIRELLDPNSTYGERLKMISKTEKSSRKQLEDLVSHKDVVLLVDHTQQGLGWSNNLIKVRPYIYFAKKKYDFISRIKGNKSLSQLRGDELEGGGELYKIRMILGKVYRTFYHPRLPCSQHLSQVLQLLRSNEVFDSYHELRHGVRFYLG